MLGMTDGMAMMAHSTQDDSGNQLLTLQLADQSTGGQLWTYNVSPTTLIADQSSLTISSAAYSATGTVWFQSVRERYVKFDLGRFHILFTPTSRYPLSLFPLLRAARLSLSRTHSQISLSFTFVIFPLAGS